MFRSWLVLVLGGLVAVAEAATIRVPESVGTIQAAIDLAASEGPVDTVLVGSGTYLERLEIRGKSIVLRGGGAQHTIVDGQRGGNVLTIAHAGRDCVIEDLTLTGGSSVDPQTVGTGIYVDRASPLIQRCWLVDNHARVGGGIATWNHSEPLIRDCWIAYNKGGGIFLETGLGTQGGSWNQVFNTVIVRNFGSGVYALKGARAQVENCTIAYNTADGVRAKDQAIVQVRRSIITHNEGFGVVRLQADPTVCFTLFCNNVFDNQDGNWAEQSAPHNNCAARRGNGSMFFEPCYRNAGSDDFHIRPTSPLCLLREHNACGAIGAYEDDPCSDRISDCTVAIQETTWGRIKTLYGDSGARRP